MRLFEFEGKTLFRSMGIPTPRGSLATDMEEAKRAAGNLGYPVAIKSQILRGGRGKAGGIKFAGNEDELVDNVTRLLGMDLSGERVEKLLIEEKVCIAREYYVGITLDPEASLPMLIVSSEGGVDIELVAETRPERLFRKHIDPAAVQRLHHMIDAVSQLGLRGKELLGVSEIALSLLRCYFRYEAITAEINPLLVTVDGKVLAGDSKLEIDDSALFRLRETRELQRDRQTSDALEAEAQVADISYVPLGKGNIGLISGGAGLGMASMDMIAAHGGAPANFLDLGGGASLEKTATALKIVLKTPGVEGVLINVFGGINNCEEMARGVVRTVDELNPCQKIVVKMRGHSQEEGWALLESRRIPMVKFGTTEEAVVLLLKEMKRKEATGRGHLGR